MYFQRGPAVLKLPDSVRPCPAAGKLAPGEKWCPTMGHRQLVRRPACGRRCLLSGQAPEPARLDPQGPAAQDPRQSRGLTERAVRLGRPGHASIRGPGAGAGARLRACQDRRRPADWPVSSGSTGCPGRWCRLKSWNAGKYRKPFPILTGKESEVASTA